MSNSLYFCDCGSTFKYKNKHQHLKTQKHKRFIAHINDNRPPKPIELIQDIMDKMKEEGLLTVNTHSSPNISLTKIRGYHKQINDILKDST